MYAACPSIWVRHLNKTGSIILKKWTPSFKVHVVQKSARESELHERMYCIFSHITFFLQEYCFLFKGLPCLQNNYFEEVVYFLRKWSCRKWSCRFSGSGGELHSRIGWIFLWKEDCKYSQRNIDFFQECSFFCRRKFRSQIMDRCSDKGECAKR